MAESPAHQLGEFLGWFLENTMIREIQPIAKQFGLYLDHEHPRSARNGNQKVRWLDQNGNHHDLDIVLEKNGTDKQVGVPVAFIEMAWRRYTKHSKNKAQEISDSVRAVVKNNSTYAPFYSTVLAGVFTKNSIKQLRSEGFTVLYFPLSKVESAFQNITSINISTTEKTPESKIQQIFNSLHQLSNSQIEDVGDELIRLNQSEYNHFISDLINAINRQTAKVFVSSNFSVGNSFTKIAEAIAFLQRIDLKREYRKASFEQFKIEILFNNNESIVGNFNTVVSAIKFLKLNL